MEDDFIDWLNISFKVIFCHYFLKIWQYPSENKETVTYVHPTTMVYLPYLLSWAQTVFYCKWTDTWQLKKFSNLKLQLCNTSVLITVGDTLLESWILAYSAQLPVSQFFCVLFRASRFFQNPSHILTMKIRCEFSHTYLFCHSLQFRSSPFILAVTNSLRHKPSAFYYAAVRRYICVFVLRLGWQSKS